jgi:hypothetical protein
MTDRDKELDKLFEDEYFELPQVIKVLDEQTVVINRGSEDGIKPGSRYLVFQLGEELWDPSTGNSLGRLEVVRGRASVVHVQPKLSTLRSVEFRRTSAPRKVTRYPGGSSLFGREEVQEGPDEQIVDLDAHVGDLVKPI